MPDAQSDQVSQLIASIFNKLGINPPFIKTILLGEGYYAGRKYRAGGYHVIWWIKKNLIEVFDDDGQRAETITLDQKMGMTG